MARADVLIVSLGGTAGLREADAELAASLRRAARAQPRSVSANVRVWRGAAADTTATDAPARSSEPASAASATRQPWVEPSETRRTSTAIAPGRLPCCAAA